MKKLKFYLLLGLFLLSVTACTKTLNDTPPQDPIENEVPNCAADGAGCQQIYTPENPSPLSNSENIYYCNEAYEPVCAKVQVECVTAPCPSHLKTFSNKCHLGQNRQATFLHEGICE